MAYFGVIFFANMGGGGGQNYFQIWGRQRGVTLIFSDLFRFLPICPCFRE